MWPHQYYYYYNNNTTDPTTEYDNNFKNTANELFEKKKKKKGTTSDAYNDSVKKNYKKQKQEQRPTEERIFSASSTSTTTTTTMTTTTMSSTTTSMSSSTASLSSRSGIHGPPFMINKKRQRQQQQRQQQSTMSNISPCPTLELTSSVITDESCAVDSTEKQQHRQLREKTRESAGASYSYRPLGLLDVISFLFILYYAYPVVLIALVLLLVYYYYYYYCNGHYRSSSTKEENHSVSEEKEVLNPAALKRFKRKITYRVIPYSPEEMVILNQDLIGQRLLEVKARDEITTEDFQIAKEFNGITRATQQILGHAPVFKVKVVRSVPPSPCGASRARAASNPGEPCQLVKKEMNINKGCASKNKEF